MAIVILFVRLLDAWVIFLNKPLVIIVFFALLSISIFIAQSDAQGQVCPEIVTQALVMADDECTGLERNNACYGFNRVSATFADVMPEDFFSSLGDKAGLNTLTSIATSPMDEAVEEWGVALMRIQANIPGTLPGQAVVFVLIGDISLENSVPADAAFEPAATPISLTSTVNANLRSQPTTRSNVVGSAAIGTELLTDAISDDGEWLRVVSDDGITGWIFGELVTAAGDVTSLPVYTSESYTPMQAFSFKSGLTQPSCTEAPSLLLVQGPEGIAVNITANGADIQIGSTIALQTTDDNDMRVTTLSGEAQVEGLAVPEGYQVEIPLNESGDDTNGPVSLPRPMSREALASFQAVELLSTNVLNYQIELPSVPPPPLVTRAPVVQPENTEAVQPGITPTPAAPGTVDCAPFRPTSPLDGAFYGMNTFYWDGAPGATSYRVIVEGGPSGSTSSGTNLTLDLSSMGQNPQISWYVEALQNDVGACRSQTVTIPREWSPTPTPTTVCVPTVGGRNC